MDKAYHAAMERAMLARTPAACLPPRRRRALERKYKLRASLLYDLPFGQDANLAAKNFRTDMLACDPASVRINDEIPPETGRNARAPRILEHFAVAPQSSVDTLNERANGHRNSGLLRRGFLLHTSDQEMQEMHKDGNADQARGCHAQCHKN